MDRRLGDDSAPAPRRTDSRSSRGTKEDFELRDRDRDRDGDRDRDRDRDWDRERDRDRDWDRERGRDRVREVDVRRERELPEADRRPAEAPHRDLRDELTWARSRKSAQRSPPTGVWLMLPLGDLPVTAHRLHIGGLA